MRVLIVEDERKIATDLQLALTEAGYVMDLAFDGEEAWYLGVPPAPQHGETVELGQTQIQDDVVDGALLRRRSAIR